MQVYLDNNATTRTDPEAVAAMLPYFIEHFANPSSRHREGAAAAAALGAARWQVAKLVGAQEAFEIVFTSGGTEANNLALAQAGSGDRNEIVVSAVEHPAILATCRGLESRGLKTVVVGVDEHGRLDMDAYAAALSPRTALVSLMTANNETGTVFPIRACAAKAKACGALFHTDAVQAAGRIPLDVAESGIDMLSLSAHKLHGPKGVGALYVRTDVRCAPILAGGRQERGRRPGTQNLPGIVGFGRAAELAKARLAADVKKIGLLRDRFEATCLRRISACQILGDVGSRLPGTTCIAFDAVEGEVVLDGLDRIGVCASSGAACASGMIDPSHVVRAMKVPESAAHGAIRFSFARENTEAEVDYVLARLPDIVDRARAVSIASADGFF